MFILKEYVQSNFTDLNFEGIVDFFVFSINYGINKKIYTLK